MTSNDNPPGEIEISPVTVASIVSQAINQCYGVVGMAHKNLVNGIATLLSSDRRRGIEIFFNNGQIEINVYVIVQYGVRIKVVAESIQDIVKFQVEKTLGLPVYAVNVYVQGLRLSEEEGHKVRN
jgi:uncharacterized alkaline shock family protein YloU